MLTLHYLILKINRISLLERHDNGIVYKLNPIESIHFVYALSP